MLLVGDRRGMRGRLAGVRMDVEAKANESASVGASPASYLDQNSAPLVAGFGKTTSSIPIIADTRGLSHCQKSEKRHSFMLAHEAMSLLKTPDGWENQGKLSASSIVRHQRHRDDRK